MTRLKKAPNVRVTALISFDGVYAGDSSTVPDSPRVRGWESAGLVKVESIDGTYPSGPGAAEPNHPGGGAPGTEDIGTAGAEPGEGSGTG